MKTKTGSSRLALLAIAMTAACVSQPVFGVPDHQLVITEISSTRLLATYDGSALVVLNISRDEWDIETFFFLDIATGNDILSWTEPGQNSSNRFLLRLGGQSFVISDVGGPGDEPDGFTYLRVATDTLDNVPIDVTFHDNATASEAVHPAPDTGTTFSLFGLSLTGLALLRRKFC